MERRGVAIEREANDRYLAAYLEDHVGEEFSGRIRGVTRFGLFVMLDETGADGFLPVRTLGDERYDFVEQRHALVGAHTGNYFRLGEAVRVRIVEAAPLRGGLVFEMLSEPAADPDFKARPHAPRAERSRRSATGFKGKPKGKKRR